MKVDTSSPSISQRIESWLDAELSRNLRLAITCTVLCLSSLIVLYTHHPEWLLRVGVLAIGLLALFFTSNGRVVFIVSVAVLSLSFGLIFYRLGEGSLYNWDEAIYAQVSAELSKSHQWLSLTWNNAPFFHKPPVEFWLTSLTYNLIGITEFAARFWSAFFGFGVLVMTFLFGCRVRRWTVGVTAVLLLLSVDHEYFSYWYNFVGLARVGMLETAFIFWTTVSLLIGWESRRRRALTALIGIPVGLAIMTKAWLGLIPVAVLIAFEILRKRTNAFQWKLISISMLLAATIVLPWHLWQVWRNGSPFVHDYVVVNLLGRVSGTVEGHHYSGLYYFNVISQGFPIWKYLLPLAVIWALWNASKHRSEKHLLLLLWMAVPLVLLSLSQTKLGWYISVTYPPLALLMAITLDEIVGQRLALAGVAFIAALCCVRLPVASDGSPDIKTFAATHAELFRNRRIYVAGENLQCGSPPPSMYEHNYNGNIPPALLFYTQATVTCVPIDRSKSSVEAETSSVIYDKSLGPLTVYIGD